jgi:nitrogen fixation NifU-like protein
MTEEGLDGLYRELLLDHAKRGHGLGLREGFAVESHGLNRSCGDEITVRVHLREPAGDNVPCSASARASRFVAISWAGEGCAISRASASMLSALVAEEPDGLDPARVGERIAALRAMLQSRGSDPGSPELLGDAVALHGVSRYPARIGCAMLAWTTLEDALRRLPAVTGPASGGQ